MNPRDLHSVLTALIPTRQATFVEGPPGIGKSSIVYQAAASIYDGATVASAVGGFPDVNWFVPIRAVDRDPIDFRGVLYVSDGKSQWTLPDLIDRLYGEDGKDGGVICIEELPQAVPAVQCVLRELLLERAIAGHKIPDNWTVVGTGNRQEDRAGAGRLLSHVAGSVFMLDLAPCLDSWQRWAIERGIRVEIRSFLRFQPASFHNFDAARKVNTDGRGWEMISNVFDAVPPRLRQEVYGGKVTPADAGSFLDFLELYENLPDPDDILKDPTGAPVPTEASVRYALSGAIVERCRNSNGQTVEAASVYAGRLQPESAMKMYLDLQVVDGRVASSKSYTDFLRAHPELCAAIGGAA